MSNELEILAIRDLAQTHDVETARTILAAGRRLYDVFLGWDEDPLLNEYLQRNESFGEVIFLLPKLTLRERHKTSVAVLRSTGEFGVMVRHALNVPEYRLDMWGGPDSFEPFTSGQVIAAIADLCEFREKLVVARSAAQERFDETRAWLKRLKDAKSALVAAA